MQAAYGLTNRLSFGVRIPYVTQDNRVQAAFDNRTATVGINPAVPGGVAPLSVPGTRLPTTEDIQALLQRLGFTRVQDWSDASFGDICGKHSISACWSKPLFERVLKLGGTEARQGQEDSGLSCC